MVLVEYFLFISTTKTTRHIRFDVVPSSIELVIDCVAPDCRRLQQHQRERQRAIAAQGLRQSTCEVCSTAGGIRDLNGDCDDIHRNFQLKPGIVIVVHSRGCDLVVFQWPLAKLVRACNTAHRLRRYSRTAQLLQQMFVIVFPCFHLPT